MDQTNDSEPMHIMLNLGCRTILIKSVWTLVALVWGAMQPLANMKHTKVYGFYRIGLSTGELEKKQKRYEGKKLESYSSSRKLFSL